LRGERLRVTVGDSRPAARSKASKRHPSTGNLSGKTFDRPSDRRRSYGPAGGPGPAPAGDSGSTVARSRVGEPAGAAPGPHESLLPGLAICVLRQRDTRDVALTRLPNCGSYLKNRRSTNAGDPKFTWPDAGNRTRRIGHSSFSSWDPRTLLVRGSQSQPLLTAKAERRSALLRCWNMCR
jgi:hypothetical protein